MKQIRIKTKKEFENQTLLYLLWIYGAPMRPYMEPDLCQHTADVSKIARSWRGFF